MKESHGQSGPDATDFAFEEIAISCDIHVCFFSASGMKDVFEEKVEVYLLLLTAIVGMAVMASLRLQTCLILTR